LRIASTVWEGRLDGGEQGGWEGPHQSRLKRAVGKMEPIEVGGVVWMGGREDETPVAVLVYDPFYTGAGFGEKDWW
jgi:hypothetical protein